VRQTDLTTCSNSSNIEIVMRQEICDARTTTLETLDEQAQLLSSG